MRRQQVVFYMLWQFSTSPGDFKRRSRGWGSKFFLYGHHCPKALLYSKCFFLKIISTRLHCKCNAHINGVRVASSFTYTRLLRLGCRLRKHYLTHSCRDVSFMNQQNVNMYKIRIKLPVLFTKCVTRYKESRLFVLHV
jgi:hypothetical protein